MKGDRKDFYKGKKGRRRYNTLFPTAARPLWARFFVPHFYGPAAVHLTFYGMPIPGILQMDKNSKSKSAKEYFLSMTFYIFCYRYAVSKLLFENGL